MSKRKRTAGETLMRNLLAGLVLGFSALAITVLGGVAIWRDSSNTMTIFNSVLPMFASWVGTILAFYYGRENFEAAADKVIEMAAGGKQGKELVASAMRQIEGMTYFQIPQGKDDKDVKLSELRAKFVDQVSRLPIVDADRKPRYMIHDSRIGKYLSSEGKAESDTLADFVSWAKEKKLDVGLGRGFVVVSENTTLSSAKSKMQESASCQDIFVTKTGKPDEPLSGWISNVRLSKSLET